MEKKYYLLLKQHNVSGLKYLCFHYGTYQSCFSYNGSGLYWKSHLKKHGVDISTIVLSESIDKSEISKFGIFYSNLWDVVNSINFANLIIENAESDPSKLHTKEAREKRVISLKERISKSGLTEKEKIAKAKAMAVMHSPEKRKRAIESIRNRCESKNFTDKMLKRGENRSKRISDVGFTDKELEFHKRISDRQINLSMKERLKNPNWIHPNKGKTHKEIYGENYIHPKRGKTMKDFKGNSYIDPKAKPFKIIVNNLNTYFFESEKDFIDKTNLTSPMLCKIKRDGALIIKRQSNSRHVFANGDLLNYDPITLNEYKQIVGS